MYFILAGREELNLIGASDTGKQPIVSDLGSDNSQSSISTPPDITKIETNELSVSSLTYANDPPDLNPENPDLPDDITRSPVLISTTSETLEVQRDSDSPPDITGSNDFTAYSDVPDDPDDLALVQATFSEVELSEALETKTPGLSFDEEEEEEYQQESVDSEIFSSLQDEPELFGGHKVTPAYLASFRDSAQVETLQAVAPGDILPVYNLTEPSPVPQIQPNLPLTQYTSLQQAKRGPGRPRKDGLDPVRKKKPYVYFC